MKRLLLDQGLPRSTGTLLKSDGWDIAHVAEIGMSRATDGEILARARDEQRVCVTLDADFHALLATSGERHPSVVRIRREGLDATALAALLQSVWDRIESALDDGAMVTLTESAVRVAAYRSNARLDDRFATEIRSIMKQDDISGQLLALGATPTPLGPDEFAALRRRDAQKCASLVRTRNIHVK